MNRGLTILKGKHVTEETNVETSADAGTANGEEELKDLEALLSKSKEEKMRQADLVHVSLNDPILIFWAQHRSFRICRSEFFCPKENWRTGNPSKLSKPIKSLKQLATYMQMMHGASREETSDMMNYFIAMLLPDEIEPFGITHDGQRIRRN